MLEEVCGSIRRIGFCPASRINPHANRRCLGPRRVLSRNLQNISIDLSPWQQQQCLTVKPFERVVDWVAVGTVTGVAKPLFKG